MNELNLTIHNAKVKSIHTHQEVEYLKGVKEVR